MNLSLTVSDPRGASLSVTVSAGSRAVDVKLDFNSAPRVVGFTSTQSWLDVGQQTELSVLATDAEGDSLSDLVVGGSSYYPQIRPKWDGREIT